MIREATPEDRAAIQRLYEILCPSEPIDVLAERIEEIGQDPNNFLLVVDDEGSVKATAFMTICLNPMFGRCPYAVLENIVVDPAHRGKGIGARLMDHIESACLQRHGTKIMLLSNSKRIRAHRFFSRMGYSDTVSRGFKKYLGERPALVSEASADA